MAYLFTGQIPVISNKIIFMYSLVLVFGFNIAVSGVLGELRIAGALLNWNPLKSFI